MKKILLFILILAFITFNNNSYIDLSKYKSQTISVEIKGEVNKPGVYELKYNAKVKDLVKIANSYTKTADRSNVNESKTLKNEDVIVIKEKSKSKKISINSASVEELCNIPGIGPSTAQKIVDYRTTNSFKTLEDIMNIKGIKTKLFEKMKEYITL